MICQENFTKEQQFSALRDLLQKKKLVIWDFDGTFCDTEPLHYRAYAQAFQHYGHHVKEEEYYPRFTHMGNGVEAECAAYDVDVNLADLMHRKREAYRRQIERGEALLFPEMQEILDLLERLQKRWVIVSNSPEKEIQDILARLQPSPPAPELIQGCEPHLGKKPEPDLFLRALERLNVTPDEALVVEDTEKGLQAARAAQIDSVWMRTRYNCDLSLSFAHPISANHRDFILALQIIRPKGLE